MSDPTPDASSADWAHIRYAYEHTQRPIEDICREHGISSGTLRDRVRRWRWTKRRAPIPCQGPPAMAVDTGTVPLARLASWGEVGERNEPGEGGQAIEGPRPTHPNPLPNGEREQAVHVADLSPSAAPETADPASIAPRLQGAVARVLPAIETIIARLSAGPLQPRELEQTARALGALTRTLRELNALLAQHQTQAAVPYDDMPEDLDAFRHELARRIRAFVASRQHERDGGATPQHQDGG